MGSLRSPRRGSTASGASRNHHLARSARPTLAIFSEDRRGFEFSLFGQRTGWDGLASLAASREYRVWRASRDHHLPRSARPTLAIFSEDRRGFEFSLFGQRTGWDSNPRGREPTRFPIVRLKPLGHPSSSNGGSGIRTHADRSPTP